MKKNIKNIDVDFFKEYGLVDFTVNDIIVINTEKGIPEVDMPTQTNMMFAIMCYEGHFSFKANEQTYSIEANHVMTIPPYTIVTDICTSPNCKTHIIGLSVRAIQTSFHNGKDVWQAIMLLRDTPHIMPLKEQDSKMINCYVELYSYKRMKTKPSPYDQEIIALLFKSILYELLNLLSENTNGEKDFKENQMRQSDVLFKRFLGLLAKDKGSHRSVRWYADELCISSKYLSTIVRANSNRTALDWIHEATINEVVRRLKYTDKTIKEIATEMNFPTLSFFGKFVKSRIGVSPSDFRKQMK